jgi:hypothetical protein
MRRLFASLSGVTFLVVMAGCQHTCGVCDCNPCNWGCCCTCAGMGYRSASGAFYAPPQAGQTLPPAVEMAPPASKVEPGKEPEKTKDMDKEPAKETDKSKDSEPAKEKDKGE